MYDEKKLNELAEELKKQEIIKKTAEEAMNAVKESIKEMMRDEGVVEIVTDKYIIKNTPVVSNRFDTKRFKADEPDTYNRYLVESFSERLSVR